MKTQQLDHDPVNHPRHYTSHPSGVECIAIAQHFCFNLGNAIKYIWRADEKGMPIQDLEMAVKCIRQEIERRRMESLRRQDEPQGKSNDLVKQFHEQAKRNVRLPGNATT